ncbi:MAG: dipeptidase [Bacteroidota bacterium]|nr:dipeptidase [Bacteroidota bacterium]
MKSNLIHILIFFPFLLLAGCATTKDVESIKQEAEQLHNEIISIDTHTDTPLKLLQKDFDIRKSHNAQEDQSKVDFPRMKEGRLDAVFFAAFIGQGPRTKSGNEEAKLKVLSIIDTIHSVIKKNSDLAEVALNASDAEKIKSKGKLAIYIGIENGYALGNDLSMIKKYYDLGARYITLCHTKNNDLCDSSTDPDSVNTYKGLSELGKKAVEEMNSIGMMIDVSHISDKAFYDVINYTKVPVIASHSCARAICNNPRNMDDAMLRKLAENGGVIQMCILSEYVKDPPANPGRDSAMSVFRNKYPGYEALTDEQKAKMRSERNEIDKKFPRLLANVSDVADHIDHIVSVAGIDHVGIGTDFDGGGGVNGCFDISEMKNITVELLKRGYSHSDIKKIWGGNFLRVFRQVEHYAQMAHAKN